MSAHWKCLNWCHDGLTCSRNHSQLVSMSIGSVLSEYILENMVLPDIL